MIKKNYKPKAGSKRERLYEHILKNPGLSMSDLSKLNLYDDSFTINRELNTLLAFGVIKEENGKYYERVQEEIVTEVVIRQPMIFKPLNTFLPTESPRGQAIERREFKTCSSKIRVQNPNNI